MKATFFILILSTCAVFNSGCELSAEDTYYPGGDGAAYYQVTSLYGEGVDDSGNMWFGISGSFDPYSNNVQVDCDGQIVNTTTETQNQNLIEVYMPAVGQYNSCNFTVYVQGQDIGAVSMTEVTAMEISTSSIQIDSNPSYLDVSLWGAFYTQPLNYSDLSVVASCNGGVTTFSPKIIYESPTEITVLIANPGYNRTETCDFQLQDTFVGNHNSQITVGSPDYSAQIFGQ